MLGVELDGFDHQVQFVGAVDLARDAVGCACLEAVGFGEVMQPIDPLGVAVQKQQHTLACVWGWPNDRSGRRRKAAPAPIRSAVEGLAGRLLEPGYRHGAAHELASSASRGDEP
jgi:hypothetical protein